MKAIIDDLSNYLGSKLGQTVYIDMFPFPTGDAVLVRADPSPMVETRYMDGSRAGAFAFSLYARSKNSETAYNILVQCAELLDLGSIGNDTEIKIDPQSQPAIVGLTDGGDFTYTASFKLEYYARR